MNETSQKYWKGVHERTKQMYGDKATEILLFGSLWHGMREKDDEEEEGNEGGESEDKQ